MALEEWKKLKRHGQSPNTSGSVPGQVPADHEGKAAIVLVGTRIYRMSSCQYADACQALSHLVSTIVKLIASKGRSVRHSGKQFKGEREKCKYLRGTLDMW